MFLVDNKGRSKGLAAQVPLASRLPPQPSDQGLCALPVPRGSADVHHRGSPEPRAAGGRERPAGRAELTEPARGGRGPLPPAETSRQGRLPPSSPTSGPRGPWGRGDTSIGAGGDLLGLSKLGRAGVGGGSPGTPRRVRSPPEVGPRLPRATSGLLGPALIRAQARAAARRLVWGWGRRQGP